LARAPSILYRKGHGILMTRLVPVTPEDLMSVETESVNQGSEDEERREALGKRIAFDGLVEVGGTLGPAFEAQAVDVSKDGMHLRTAYLPEVGQPLTCRFDAGGREVLASGEVVWRHEEGRGGEFAVQFNELDAESREALARIVDPEPTCAPKDPGARVRLHIEGLGSPMRARVKGAAETELTVGSELGFLQVGKQLELEDATTGGKRPARIDKVEVEIDPATRIPQLVVTLRYDDASSPALESAAAHAGAAPVAGRPSMRADGTPEPSTIDDPAGAEDDDAIAGVPLGMKSAFARSAAKITPAMTKLAKRAMVTLALLAARGRKSDASANPPRRTTAPPPGGGLHASGRHVVRSAKALELVNEPESLLRSKRALAIGAAAVCAVVLCFFAMRKPAGHEASNAPVVETAPPSGSLPPSIPAVTAAPAEPVLASQAPPASAEGHDLGSSSSTGDSEHGHNRPTHVAPFGSGPVAHGNLLHIKMDGAIEKIEGASTPTGFTVVIPNRRSLEAAAPLVARDSRIATMRVTNEAHGAELAVTFKDGVPNYQVRAKGDTLEIVLATAGHVLENDAPRPMLKPVANKTRHHPAAQH
jgi:PilZ domain